METNIGTANLDIIETEDELLTDTNTDLDIYDDEDMPVEGNLTQDIKSRERVSEFGEVFTPKNIVNDMLDLIKDDIADITKTVLEPACGTGNFLVEVLARRLDAIAIPAGATLEPKTDIENPGQPEQPGQPEPPEQPLSLESYELRLFQAISTIYGIDIQQDNVKETIARMLSIIETEYQRIVGTPMRDRYRSAITCILNRNILCGDCLSAKFTCGIHGTLDGAKAEEPLIISEWNIDKTTSTITLKEYPFESLTDYRARDDASYAYRAVKYDQISRYKKLTGIKPCTAEELGL